MRMLFVLSALALAAAAPAIAGQQQTTPSTSTATVENGGTAAATSAPAAAKPRKICRKEEGLSYSRMTRNVCRTQAEWDDIDARKTRYSPDH